MPFNKVNAKQLTVFGATVLSISAEKGISERQQLLNLLDKVGFKVTYPGFQGWLYGEYGVNRKFPVFFDKALNLSQAQQIRLAVAFTYGQTTPVSIAKDAEALIHSYTVSAEAESFSSCS